MPTLNPVHALRSLVPQSRDQRVYLLAALINVYGTGLIITAMTLYAIRVVHLTAERDRPGPDDRRPGGPADRHADRPAGRPARTPGCVRLSLLLLAAAAASYVFFAHSFVSYLLVAIVDGSALSRLGHGQRGAAAAGRRRQRDDVPLTGERGVQPGHIARRSHLRRRDPAQHGERVPRAVPG